MKARKKRAGKQGAKGTQGTYWNDRATFRTDADARTAIARAKLNLRAAGVRFRGKQLTEEAVFGAICLWAGAQEGGAPETALAPYVARLEALVGHPDRASELSP